MFCTARKLLLVTVLAGTAGIMLPRDVDARAVATTSASERAAALETRAEKLLGVPEQWRAAARLLEEAAALRSPGDPIAVQDLVLAGGAWYYSGSRGQGQTVFVQAAERALADGDVEGSARAFVRAALIAYEQHDGSAPELLARAERLAGSPLLNETQRRAILGRVVTPAQPGL